MEAYQHILRRRPKAVVMETSREESLQMIERSGTPRLGSGQATPPEAMAHAAALACGARVVAADRPKRITYARLLFGSRVEELDEAYAEEVARNYERTVARSGTRCMNTDVTRRRKDAFQRVVVDERDAGMARALAMAMEEHGAENVVAVVGRRHRNGIRKHLVQRWRKERGQDIHGPTLEEHLEWNVAVPEDLQWREEHPVHYGVKRALFERVLAMATDPSVLQDARRWMGPMKPEEAHAHAMAEEVYGAPRMMLACVPEEVRKNVVCARHGQEKSFVQALEILEQVRPCRGGSGYSDRALQMLRGLHFHIE